MFLIYCKPAGSVVRLKNISLILARCWRGLTERQITTRQSGYEKQFKKMDFLRNRQFMRLFFIVRRKSLRKTKKRRAEQRSIGLFEWKSWNMTSVVGAMSPTA